MLMHLAEETFFACSSWTFPSVEVNLFLLLCCTSWERFLLEVIEERDNSTADNTAFVEDSPALAKFINFNGYKISSSSSSSHLNMWYSAVLVLPGTQEP